MCGTATRAHEPSLQHPLRPPPALYSPRVFSCKPEQHTTSFALAADSLEATVCIAVHNGHLLSAMRALAKANLFWILHAGRLHMSGRIDPAPMFATYRTDANLLHPRCRTAHTRGPASFAGSPAITANGVSATARPQPEAGHTHRQHADEPSLVAPSNATP
eukprot:4543800-Pleurochrysis_carterae.AAC.1